MEVFDAHSAAFEHVQAGSIEEGDDFCGLYVAVAMMKVCKTTLLLTQSSEINDEHASARLQNPAHLSGALFTKVARQMMKHQGAQDDIELGVGKRELIDRFVFKDDIYARLSRLRTSPL